MINLGFWETAHLPLPYANINIYFLLREKWWLRLEFNTIDPKGD